MILRRFIVPETGCASYLFGCTSKGQVGVVDPHVELVEDYIEAAAAAGARIAQVFDTHVHADHPIDIALDRLQAHDGILPVVDRADARHVEGVIVRNDLQVRMPPGPGSATDGTGP